MRYCVKLKQMKITLSFFLFVSVINISAQNESSTCFFGSVGVDFRCPEPQIIYPINMTSYESLSSICDSSDEVLFYTNGGCYPSIPNIIVAVWNAKQEKNLLL